MDELVYYAYKSRDGHVYLMREVLNPALMTGDYPLFSTAEECETYWKENGMKIDRRCF